MLRKNFHMLIPLAALLVSLHPALAAGARLVPVGEVVGIRLEDTGVVVTEVKAEGPGAKAGLLPGDRILSVNGAPVETAQALTALVQAGDEGLVLRILREGREQGLRVSPEEGALGVWVRDSLAGIGTVTWYDPETGRYGALGHPVGETETGKGQLYPAEVSGVKVGKAGEPGALEGGFTGEEPLGTVEANTPLGIFGVMARVPGGETVPVATRAEIKPGPVTILSQASGQVEAYTGEIQRVYPTNKEGRSLLIKITDERLTTLTGGIVQGMSGSPILQEGRLVGAVTHVLIGDPTRGYGITAEEMLAADEQRQAA